MSRFSPQSRPKQGGMVIFGRPRLRSSTPRKSRLHFIHSFTLLSGSFPDWIRCFSFRKATVHLPEWVVRNFICGRIQDVPFTSQKRLLSISNLISDLRLMSRASECGGQGEKPQQNPSSASVKKKAFSDYSQLGLADIKEFTCSSAPPASSCGLAAPCPPRIYFSTGFTGSWAPPMQDRQ